MLSLPPISGNQEQALALIPVSHLVALVKASRLSLEDALQMTDPKHHHMFENMRNVPVTYGTTGIADFVAKRHEQALLAPAKQATTVNGHGID